ncbi:Cutinase palindrome-binding protein [Podosphaera aphanis]|nr:Cutinase palindrome-binding protein [Podosphaera aphanis]
MNSEYFVNSGGQTVSQEPLNVIDHTKPWIFDGSVYSDLENIPFGLQTDFCPSSIQGVPAKDGKTESFEYVNPSFSNPTNNLNNSTPGAGPLPISFSAPVAQDRISGVSEFTKRKNWPQRIIEEIKDFLHVLTPDGKIIYLSPSGEHLTGYSEQELKGRFIVDFIHPDDSGMFMREFNESISSGHPLRFYYRFRKKDDTHAIFESLGHPHSGTEVAAFGGNSSAGFCRGVFMMARPYPTKNSALLDSFLEHKTENQRLKKRINDLRREEKEEKDESQRKLLKRPDRSINSHDGDGRNIGYSDTLVHDRAVKLQKHSNTNIQSMPPPAVPKNAPLTKQALEKSNASFRPDSIHDKMARFDAANRIESIEMLTGLRYREGERSQGISTGAQSPMLVTGDAGIAIPLDKEGKGDKKKKSKFPDEYVCTDCGIIDSPEWRKGPSGPKTLCNACGLRWAKKEKKKTRLPDTASAATFGDSFRE